MRGAENKILTKDNRPLHEAAEDLLNRDQLKHRLQKSSYIFQQWRKRAQHFLQTYNSL